MAMRRDAAGIRCEMLVNALTTRRATVIEALLFEELAAATERLAASCRTLKATMPLAMRRNTARVRIE